MSTENSEVLRISEFCWYDTTVIVMICDFGHIYMENQCYLYVFLIVYGLSSTHICQLWKFIMPLLVNPHSHVNRCGVGWWDPQPLAEGILGIYVSWYKFLHPLYMVQTKLLLT